MQSPSSTLPPSSSLSPRRRRIGWPVAMLAGGWLAGGSMTGCATQPKMLLANQSPHTLAPARTSTLTVFWIVEDPEAFRPPIVAIEHRGHQRRTRQIVFCDRGLRMFLYQGDRLLSSSPPIPGPNSRIDLTMARAVLRRYARGLAGPHGPTPIDSDAIDDVRSVRDIPPLLRDRWPALEVNPPAGLRYADILAELQSGRHGVLELLAASQAF